MQLNGFHHLTAITADAKRNHDFYTRVLGLRLVKKTVNQDDVSAYHLFYADGAGSPGTDITFFHWPTAPERRGTHSICRTGFRITGEKAFSYWADRLKAEGVAHETPTIKVGMMTLDFEDFEGQRLSFVQDKSETPFAVWQYSPVPPEHQIHGLGPITLSVPEIDATRTILEGVMGMTAKAQDSNTHIYWMNGEGPVRELHVRVEPDLQPARQGAGSVHHVAFNIPMTDYEAWVARLAEYGIRNSGPVDRFWFKSLYFREPNGILFELATDGPGFAADEPLDKLGETLSLPPFLEARRTQIEAGLVKI
jgi:glyoxalase family protein